MHLHQDHFDPAIFDLPATAYILSDDIKAKKIPEEKQAITTRVRKGESLTLEGIPFSFLGSTDSGISFLFTLEGKKMYHAGDNNIWYWDDDDMHMIQDFKDNIEPLPKLDIAFFPIDPRIKENAFLGPLALYEKTKVAEIFPMHLWEEYDECEKAAKFFKARQIPAIINIITGPGQIFRR